jgi:hypothetical protein
MKSIGKNDGKHAFSRKHDMAAGAKICVTAQREGSWPRHVSVGTLFRKQERGHMQNTKELKYRLYDLAYLYKKTKLWETLLDGQIFAVKFSDGEIGYICILHHGDEWRNSRPRRLSRT